MRKAALIHLSALFLTVFFLIADVAAEEYYFVTLEYPPLEYKDKAGLAKGVAVEIVTQIMTALGHSVSIEVLPWARAVKMVRYGRADAIFTIFKNDERELFLDYSGEILVPQMVAFYARKDRPIVYGGNLQALKHLRIGVVSTISYGRRFDRARSMLKVERTADLEQNFKKLMLGRIDLVINNVYSAEIVINALNLADQVQRLEPDVESVPSYIAYSKIKKLATLRESFDRKLIELKQNGTYARILSRSGLNIETNALE